MNNTSDIKEVKNILLGICQGERLLRQANDHMDASMMDAAQKELLLAFERLAPLPPRVNALIKRAKNHVLFPAETEWTEVERIADPLCYYESPFIFRCDIHAPPFLRDQKNGKYYSAVVGLEIEEAVIKILTARDHRFRKIYAIFVSHITVGNKAPQLYYDNDNLLVKRILDSIVPFIAVDDSVVYCSNLYTYVEDGASAFTVYIVEEGHLLEWAKAHTEVNFAQEINLKTC